MPTFSYKGYDLEVDHDPSAEEFAQMSAHIDSLPPKGEQEALKQKNADIGNKVLGGIEAAGSMLAPLPSQIIGGLHGLGALAAGQGYEQAAKNVEAAQKSNFGFGAFKPKTEKGKQYSEAVGRAFAYPGEKVGEVLEENIGPKSAFAGKLLTDLSMNFLNLGLPVAGLKGGAVLAGKGMEAMRRPKAAEAPVGGAKGLAAELAAPEPTAPLKGQGELFASETEGLASPYDAGQAGVTEPITPQRARAQMELGLRNDLPDTMLGDERGVITPELPNEAMQLAKERAGRAEVVPEGPAPVQADLFAPETNVHRAYTDIRAATEAGGERPLSRTEFEQVHQNLAKEPVTAHEIPLDMDTAYQSYLEQVSGKQADMFDIGSRQEAFGQQAFKEQVARQLEEHPFVKNAEKALAKQEKFVSDLKEQVAAGTTRATALVTEIKALEKAQEKVAKVRENVETALTNKQKPVPFNTRTRKQGGGVKIDWKDNNKLDVIKENPAFAESMKQVGHAQIKSPEEAVALAKSSPDVSQNIAQRAVNAFTKGGTYLKAKVNNPVVHYTVDRFLDADNAAKAAISEKLHGEYLGSLRKLNKSEYTEAFALLNAADLSKKTITPEMMQRHGLSPALQEFITSHQNIMADVLKQINEAREAVGKKPIEARDAYSAMNMSGDFRKAAYKTIDGERQVVGVIGANSKTIGKNSLANLEKQMKAKDPSLEFGPLQDTSSRRGSSRGTPHEAFMDVLQTMGENNPAMKEFLDTLAEVSKSDATNYLGMQKHTMQKKGVWGMEGRKPWLDEASNARDFFENQTRYIEGAYQWGGLAKAAKDVNAVLREGDVATKQTNAVALSEQYMQNALGLNPSKMGRAVNDAFNALFASMGIGPSIPKDVLGVARQVANTFMLSLNVPFLAIQLLQPIIATPGMVSFLRSRGMSPEGYGGPIKAMQTLHKIRAGKPLNALEEGAFKYAKDNHVYATDMVEHTAQTQKGPAYYTSKATQSPAAFMETGTRATAYLTMVHILHEGGLTPAKGLYEQAHRMTDMAMTNYGALEKPAIYNALGPLGSVAYNLKSFGHNEISRWAMFAREIPNNHNAMPLLTQMATTIAVAGVMGLPFMSQWETLYDYITKKTGNPRSLALDVLKVSESLGESLGEKGKHVLSNGLGTLAGMDISSRVGLGDVLPSHASDVAFAGGSKLGQMASSVAGAIARPSEETMKSAAINIAPPFMQGPIDLAWFSKGDIAYSKDPSNLKPVARRNDTDKLMKSIGLLGINESVQKQKAYQNQQLDMARMEIRKAAMNTLTQDMFRNRPMLQKTLDKYFINGEGDPQTFATEIEKKAIGLHLTPAELALLRSAASNSITKARSLQRRMQ